MAGFTISVVIPVKNGSATLERCLRSLRNQTLGKELEIIIADSMSVDNSREIALQYGATIIDIPEGSFDHGLTRNLAAQQASGQLIYFTVQDAWAASNDMLEKMATHFEDGLVKAVVGHQAVPHEKDKNPMLWFRPVSAASVTERLVTDPDNFKNLPVKEQQALAAWDNVVAMYRKTALTEQPFVQTAFAEDWIWSYNALQKGWKLLHDSSLLVYHYHHHTFQYAFRTTYTINYHFYKFFGYIPTAVLPFMPLIRVSWHVGKNKRLRFAERVYWIGHNFLSVTATFLSNLDFLIRLKAGRKNAVEKGYNKYCKLIPQGKQKQQ